MKHPFSSPTENQLRSLETAIELGCTQFAPPSLPATIESAHARIRELEIQALMHRAELATTAARAERAELQLCTQIRFVSKPAMVGGRIVQLASRAELGAFFGVSGSTIDEWHKRGVIPPAIQPPQAIKSSRKSSNGRKYLRWDFHQTIDQVMRFRSAA
jgi:hypothetical protein